MMDISKVLLLWFMNVLMKKPQVVVLNKLNKTKNQLKNSLTQSKVIPLKDKEGVDQVDKGSR